MKDYIKGASLALVAVAVIAATTAQAGMFSGWATGDWPTEESTAFKVEAYGYDFRVYEWTSPSNTDVTCSAAFTDSGAIGYQCFAKVGE